mmetsp:Transcript_5083/g.22901  ORF Transcript_5083/g.22901 Transcript_5083/m.22901 type:complete len:204 (-) Transcript_5083:406-1017(-)
MAAAEDIFNHPAVLVGVADLILLILNPRLLILFPPKADSVLQRVHRGRPRHRGRGVGKFVACQLRADTPSPSWRRIERYRLKSRDEVEEFVLVLCQCHLVWVLICVLIRQGLRDSDVALLVPHSEHVAAVVHCGFRRLLALRAITHLGFVHAIAAGGGIGAVALGGCGPVERRGLWRVRFRRRLRVGGRGRGGIGRRRWHVHA